VLLIEQINENEKKIEWKEQTHSHQEGRQRHLLLLPWWIEELTNNFAQFANFTMIALRSCIVFTMITFPRDSPLI